MIVRVQVNTALVEEARKRGNHPTKKAAAIAALNEYIAFKKEQNRLDARLRKEKEQAKTRSPRPRRKGR